MFKIVGNRNETTVPNTEKKEMSKYEKNLS